MDIKKHSELRANIIINVIIYNGIKKEWKSYWVDVYVSL